MDNALQALLSWNFLLFCLAVTAATYIIRTIVDYFIDTYIKSIKYSELWSKLVIKILPLIIGVIGALFAKKYPYPSEIVSVSGRVAFGLVSGLLAGFAWRFVKSAITSKILSFQSGIPSVSNVEKNIVQETEVKKDNV